MEGVVEMCIEEWNVIQATYFSSPPRAMNAGIVENSRRQHTN